MGTLILIPGLAGDAAMWREQLRALAPWQPQVSDVHTREDGIPAMAAALLRQQEVPLVLCGASMGGMVAMEAARQAPERVAGLALLGTDARPDSPEMTALREAAIVLFAQGRAREVIEPNIAMAFHPDNAAALGAAYLEFVLDAGAEQLIRQNRAVIARPDARPHLPRLQCPVLVLCGEADLLAPPERSREIAALVPHAQLVMVPRCGHMLTMERPEVVNAELRAWLSSVIPAQAGTQGVENRGGSLGFPPARE
jgi:pimeloyl-ACP methyl ester carboxylesterase